MATVLSEKRYEAALQPAGIQATDTAARIRRPIPAPHKGAVRG